MKYSGKLLILQQNTVKTGITSLGSIGFVHTSFFIFLDGVCSGKEIV